MDEHWHRCSAASQTRVAAVRKIATPDVERWNSIAANNPVGRFVYRTRHLLPSASWLMPRRRSSEPATHAGRDLLHAVVATPRRLLQVCLLTRLTRSARLAPHYKEASQLKVANRAGGAGVANGDAVVTIAIVRLVRASRIH
jgi:hypothetical protein